MACGIHAREIEESTITSMFNERYLRDFPHIGALRKEQKTRLVNLAREKDVFCKTGDHDQLLQKLYILVGSTFEKTRITSRKQAGVQKSLLNEKSLSHNTNLHS